MKTGAPKSEFPAILGWCETYITGKCDISDKVIGPYNIVEASGYAILQVSVISLCFYQEMKSVKYKIINVFIKK
jgi:hypothetical protein